MPEKSRARTALPGNIIKRQIITPEDIIFFGSLRVPAARLLRRQLALGSRPYTQVDVLETAFVVGRDKRCDIVLDDPQVSNHHLRVARQQNEIFVEDLDSANGTYLNGQRIRGRVRVRAGDFVGVGSTTFTVAADGNLEQRDYRGNVAIEAQAVTIDVPQKRLIEEVSLTVYPSEFVGLMGPSGAGKTTLMNAMNGYTPPSGGAVLFNGRDLYANYGQFRNVMGYVPQDDIMHGDLTVGQALYYTARLRLPKDFSDPEINKRVEQVMSQLGLEGTEDVLIGSPQKKGISGGQRKRVNLAMELLTDPSVLFLDEPTSGLSSEDALMVMKVLRKLADEGKTIILTIHQPSLEAYRLLDNLILVGKDKGSPDPGRLAYYGPAYPQAVDFFNPDGVPDLPHGVDPSPDEVLRGFSKKETKDWTRQYTAWPLKRQYVDQRAGKHATAAAHAESPGTDRTMGLTQWWTLVRRCFAIKLRDRMNTAILLAQAPIIALLIALVLGKQAAEEITPDTWPNVAGAVSTVVFLLALSALWFGCSNSAREIVGEWAIYRRERMVNLKIPSYVASKFTVLGGLCVVQCVILLAIVHWISGLSGPWLPMFGILLLTALVGLAIGLTISSLARTSEVAIALLPLILLPMVILAGVLQPVHKMNSAVQFLAHCMPARWAFESLLILESDERPTWSPPEIEFPTPPAVPQGTLRESPAANPGRIQPPSATPATPPEPGARSPGPPSTSPADSATGTKRMGLDGGLLALRVPGGAQRFRQDGLLAATDTETGDDIGTTSESAEPEEDEEEGDESTRQRDMAEEFFPQETERMGVRAGVIALASMFILLAVAVHLVLRSRDVH
jgi:ABC-type multidrug transport system ATPase subunit/ABC-type multidrug transport system permease subunit